MGNSPLQLPHFAKFQRGWIFHIFYYVSRNKCVGRIGGKFVFTIYKNFLGRDSSVGLATHYGLEGPGLESGFGRDFLHLSRPVLEPT